MFISVLFCKISHLKSLYFDRFFFFFLLWETPKASNGSDVDLMWISLILHITVCGWGPVLWFKPCIISTPLIYGDITKITKGILFVEVHMMSPDTKASKCHLKFSSKMTIFIKLVYLSSVISLK